MAHRSSWFFSRMPLSSLTPSGSTSATATKTPLGFLSAGPDEAQPRPHLTLRHLHVGASRTTSSELLEA